MQLVVLMHTTKAHVSPGCIVTLAGESQSEIETLRQDSVRQNKQSYTTIIRRGPAFRVQFFLTIYWFLESWKSLVRESCTLGNTIQKAISLIEE